MKKLQGLLKNKILGLEERLAETDKRLVELHSPAVSLEDAPFRNVIFRYKNTPVISHPLLDKVKGSPVSFKDLCSALVKYIISSRSLVDKLGNIKCDSVLKRMFACTDENNGTDRSHRSNSITFFQLMKKIGRIID